MVKRLSGSLDWFDIETFISFVDLYYAHILMISQNPCRKRVDFL